MVTSSLNKISPQRTQRAQSFSLSFFAFFALFAVQPIGDHHIISANRYYRTTFALSLRQRRVNQTNAGPGKLTDTGVIIPTGQATTAVNVGF
jgi:hypothetical protein